MTKKVDTTTPQKDQVQVESTRKPASQLLTEFLNANNMRLTITPIKNAISQVDDGSIIIKPSEISAKYIGE